MAFTEVNYRRGLVSAVMQLAKQEGYNNVELVSVREGEHSTVILFSLQRPYHTIDSGIEHQPEYGEIKQFEIEIRNVGGG